MLAARMLIWLVLSALDPPSLTKVVSDVQPAVVRVEVLDANDKVLASGSGFFISADGDVVTNEHVVANARRIVVETADGTRLDADLPKRIDRAHDLAVVHVHGEFPALAFAEPPNAGDDVLVVGHPYGSALAFSSGVVTEVRDRGVRDGHYGLGAVLDGWRLEISAAIAPGSSGSPVVDARGGVVGVAVGVFIKGKHQSFAVPVALVKALLEEAPQRSWSFRSPSIVSSLVISFLLFVAIAVLVRAPKRRKKRRPTRRKRALGPDPLRDRWIM